MDPEPTRKPTTKRKRSLFSFDETNATKISRRIIVTHTTPHITTSSSLYFHSSITSTQFYIQETSPTDRGRAYYFRNCRRPLFRDTLPLRCPPLIFVQLFVETRMRLSARPFALWVSTTSAHCTTTSTTTTTAWGLKAHLLQPRVNSFHSASSLAPSWSRYRAGAGGASSSSSSAVRSSSFSLRMSSSAASGDAGMMDNKSLRVALCQFHVTHDKEKNHITAQDYVAKAAKEGAQLAVLPEIWNSPYATAAFPEYAETLPNMGDSSEESMAGSPSSKILRDLAKQHNMWIIGGSIPEVVVVDDVDGDDSKDEDKKKIYNTCLVFNPEGTIVAKHRKVHLFDIDVPGGITFFESETLSPGETVSFFDTPVGRIGVGICYDIRFAEYAMLLRQKYNCHILIYPGAFNLTTGPAHWELLQRGRALDNQCYVVTASPARSEPPTEKGKYPHYSAWGHSTVVSPWGDIIATRDETEGVVMADLDLSRVEEVRKSIPIGKQRREDMYKLEQQE